MDSCLHSHAVTTLNAAPSAVYRLSRAAEDLVIENWGGIHTVYQRASGETHAFNEVTMALVDCLRPGPASFAEILQCVAADFGVRAEELVAADFDQMVLRLEELGLIERTVAP